MTLTLKQKENFLRKRKRLKRVILSAIKKEGGVVFGARSVNRQVPKHLESSTQDYDVFVKGDPKKTAKRIEKKLDKKFGGNFFKVKPALHEGTYKIISVTSKKGIADVSQHPKEKIKVVKRKGVKFAHLDFQKKKIKQSLADPKSKFRHDKDKFSRLRIKLSEQKKHTKHKPRKRRGGLSKELIPFSVSDIIR